MSDMEALLEERRGYVMRGLKDRVAQVDAAIKALGGVVVADVPEVAVEIDAELETADAPKGRGRRAK